MKTINQTDPEMILETSRTRLRKFMHEDLTNLLAIFTDPVTMEFFDGLFDRETTQRWLEKAINSYHRMGYGPYAVQLKATGEFIGYCGLVLQADIDGRNEVEILYGLISRFWNRGYALEAAGAVKDLAINQLEIPRCVSMIEKRHRRSENLARKNGMKLEKSVFWRGREYQVFVT